MDEAGLIEDAQRGDLDAFNRLVLEYQGQVFSVALRIMGDPDSAADATQTAFISAYKNIGSFRGGSFRSWLLRIVTNACYDELRRRRRRPTVPLEDLVPGSDEPVPEASEWLASDEEGPEAAAQRAELARAIQTCLDGLSPDFRTVAVLVDIQGYDYQEAADIVGRPLGTIKSRLARARAGLRACLEQYGELLPIGLRLENETTS